MKVTKEEAARMLGKFIGQEVRCIWQDSVNAIHDIDYILLRSIKRGHIKSFQLQLRSKDEMTYGEKIEFNLIKSKYGTLGEWAASIDYLDKIGVDTRNYKGVTFEII